MNLQQRVAFLKSLAGGHDPEEGLQKEIEGRSASFHQAYSTATAGFVQNAAAVAREAQAHLCALESGENSQKIQEELERHLFQVKKLSEIQEKLTQEIASISEEASGKVAQLRVLAQEAQKLQNLLKSSPLQYKQYEKMIVDLGTRTCAVLRS